MFCEATVTEHARVNICILCRFIFLSFDLPIYLCIYLPVYLSIHYLACLLTPYIFSHLPYYLSMRPSIHPRMHPSIHPSLIPMSYASIYRSIRSSNCILQCPTLDVVYLRTLYLEPAKITSYCEKVLAPWLHLQSRCWPSTVMAAGPTRVPSDVWWPLALHT